MASSKNLGFAKAVKRGTTPPTNTDMLWVDIAGVSSIIKYYDHATSTWLPLANTTEISFDGNRAITRTAWPTNINLGTSGLKATMEALLFPPSAPTVSLTASNSIRRLGSSNAVTLTWVATKQGTTNITAITVNGQSVAPTGNTQSGTQNTVATQNVDTTFSMSASAGALNASASVTVSWRPDRFWGKTTKNGSSQPILDSDILGADGASAGVGNELSNTRIQTRSNINGAGQYLFFAWPTSFGTPSFIVNGLSNTAWTKVRSNSPFINASGYQTNYDVWISNTVQNSPISTLQIN